MLGIRQAVHERVSVPVMRRLARHVTEGPCRHAGDGESFTYASEGGDVSSRQELFEEWAESLPREWDVTRQGESSAWPGQYREYAVQCAWEAWCEVAERAERKMRGEQ